MVQDIGNRFSSTFQKQLDRLNYFCTAENISHNLAVHEIRKTFKRMRALLKFYSDSSLTFFSELKEQILAHGRLLSNIRESAVNIQIFEKVTTSGNLIPERKIKQIKDLLFEKNRDLLKTGFQENKICEKILAFCNMVEKEIQIFENERPSKGKIFECLCNKYEKSYILFQNIEKDFDAEEMHNLRKKLKALWYQIEFLKFMHPRYFKLKSDQLNLITELLGEDHDLFVFMNDLKTTDFNIDGDENIILENHLQHLRELNHLKLSGRLKQFFNETPEVFNQKMSDILKI